MKLSWKSCLIKISSAQMKDDYELLLNHWATPVDSVQPVNIENQNMSIINRVHEESSLALQTNSSQTLFMMDMFWFSTLTGCTESTGVTKGFKSDS